MKQLQKKCKNYTERLSENQHIQESCDKTMQKSKDAFAEYEAGRFLSYFEFLYQQSFYIQKRWWGIQILLLLFLWSILQISDSNYYIQRCCGLFAPLFVILIIPELWKNYSSTSTEIEGSTFYSLSQIYSARLLLFAAIDVLLLSLFFSAAALSRIRMTVNFIIDFFIPFNITCCICFRTLCSPKAVTETLAVSLCMVWSAVWLFVLLKEPIYEKITLPVWGGLLLFTFIYMIYCARRSSKNCNLIWEVNTSWN